MSIETTQPQYRRDGLRYASDVTDAEWAQIEALLPLPKKLGRPRTTALRAVVNAMLYQLTPVVSGVCCQRSSRRFRQFSGSSTGGGTQGCGRRSTMRW